MPTLELTVLTGEMENERKQAGPAFPSMNIHKKKEPFVDFLPDCGSLTVYAEFCGAYICEDCSDESL